MGESQTTAAIQGNLDALIRTNGAGADAAVRAVIASSVERLGVLCGAMLLQSYGRLTRPPVNLRPEELLSAVVERLLKALSSARPGNVRQFFAIANQHIRWELNDLARRLDEQTRVLSLADDAVRAPESSGSLLSPNARRMLEAIEGLPEEEREVFDLVRVQGMAQTEVAELVGVSTKTVQRRLNRALVMLSDVLGDLRPADGPAPVG
jgi:RNA polymerase sigma-70 factor (ECF subfamily)